MRAPPPALAHFFEPGEGTILYHYTSIAAAKGILGSQALWLSDFTRMNDPREYAYARSCFLENHRSRQRYLDMTPRLVLSAALIGLEQNTKMFIGCLSPDDNDAHQWRQYGAEGTGCAIGLDASLLAAEAGVAMRRVVYDRANFDAFSSAGFEMLQTQFEEEPNDIAALRELAQFLVCDLFAFKHPDFAREKEIRISRLLVRAESGGAWLDVGGQDQLGNALPSLEVGAREGAHGPTPFISLPLQTRRGCAIRSITLGPAIARGSTEFDELLRASAGLAVKAASPL